MANDPRVVPLGLTTEGLLVRRFLARAIDSVIITVMVLAVFRLAGALLPTNESSWRTPFKLCVLLILWIGYGAALESSAWQATFAKYWLSLRVYDSMGGRPTLLQATGRNLLKDGPFLAFAFIPGGRLLSLFWVCVHLFALHRSPVDQALHDRAANTWVAAPDPTIGLHLS